jgi:hypothetical protein
MHRPTLNRESYLLKVRRYLLPYIGELHRKYHRLPITCSFMMLYYTLCNIRIIGPAFCLHLGWLNSRCPESSGGEIWLDLREHTIHNRFDRFDSHRSEDHSGPYRDTTVWWDQQSEFPKWLRQKGLIVWPNIRVCGQQYSREDWQITET